MPNTQKQQSSDFQPTKTIPTPSPSGESRRNTSIPAKFAQAIGKQPQWVKWGEAIATIAIIVGLLLNHYSPSYFAHPTPPKLYPSVIGIWQGCIQGNLGPNQIFTMNIIREDQTDGDLFGTADENIYEGTGFTTIVAAGPFMDAQITLKGSIRFAFDVLDEAPANSTPYTYSFTGMLGKNGGLSGVMAETPGTLVANWTQPPWTLVKTGDGCPY